MPDNETGAVVTSPRSYPIALPSSTGNRSQIGQILQFWPIPIILAAIPFVMESNLPLRIVLAVCVFFVLYASRKSANLAILSMIYMAMLGGMRRNLIPYLGEESKDPLLVVAPLVALLYGLGIALSRRLPLSDRYDWLRITLLAIMIVQILNPKQGPLLVGIAGGLFYIIPVIWSFIGRDLGSEAAMERFFYALIIVSSVGALYGIKQGIYGLSPAEQEWLIKSDYGSVYVSGVELRPFSFFTSTVEYAGFLSIGIVICWTMFLRGKRVAMLAVPLLAWGLFYTGIRTPVALTLATCVLIWAVQGATIRSWIPRAALAVVIAAGGLYYTLSHAQGSGSAIADHQAAGLLNPLDSRSSTVGAHANLVELGVKQGIMNPLGMGLGYTCLAAAKFGNGGFTSEIDFSNMLVSLGAIGGSLYIIFVLATLWMALSQWYYKRSIAALGILGILCSRIGGWLDGGDYAIAMVVWFCVGAMQYGSPRIRGRAS